MVLTEACLGETGDTPTFASSDAFSIQISQIARESTVEGTECSF